MSTLMWITEKEQEAQIKKGDEFLTSLKRNMKIL